MRSGASRAAIPSHPRARHHGWRRSGRTAVPRSLRANPRATKLILYPTIVFGERRGEDEPHRAAQGGIPASHGLRRSRLGEPRSDRRRRAGPRTGPTRIRRRTSKKFALCERLGLGPGMAIFEPGFLRTALAYHAAGRMPRGAFPFFGGERSYRGEGPVDLLSGCSDARGARPLSRHAGRLPIPWSIAVVPEIPSTGTWQGMPSSAGAPPRGTEALAPDPEQSGARRGRVAPRSTPGRRGRAGLLMPLARCRSGSTDAQRRSALREVPPLRQRPPRPCPPSSNPPATKGGHPPRGDTAAGPTWCRTWSSC